MEEYHDLSPDSWGNIFTDWFIKLSDGYISFHWIYFPHPLIFSIHRIGNLSNILFPGSRKQDESHPILYFIASCLSYTRLYIRGLINLNYTFNMFFKVNPKAKTIINGASFSNFMMVYIRRFSLIS